MLTSYRQQIVGATFWGQPV